MKRFYASLMLAFGIIAVKQCNAQELTPLTFGDQVVEAEWFIDVDPGVGLGEKIEFEPGSEFPLAFSFATQDLTPGLHQLVVRCKDDQGHWGVPRVWPFNVVDLTPFGPASAGGVAGAPKVVNGEWFLDDDPGVGNGVVMDWDGDEENPMVFDIDSAGLSAGQHHLAVRLMDDTGNWGFPRSVPVYVVPRIESTEMAWRVKDNESVIQTGILPVTLTPGQSVQSLFTDPFSQRQDNASLSLEVDLMIAGGFIVDRSELPFQLIPPPPDGGGDTIQITRHPQDQSVNAGEQLVLSVEVTGPMPLSYQWFYNGQPLSDANGIEFQIESVDTDHAGLYQVMVSHQQQLLLSTIASVTVTSHSVTESAHPADLNGDYRMSVEEVTAYGAAWKNGQPWSIEPVVIPIEYVTRAGALWKGGEVYEVDASKGVAPLWWVNTSSAFGPRSAWLPSDRSYATRSVRREDGIFNVSVDMHMAGSPLVFAGEEFIPAGYDVISISDGGTYNAETHSIRWGPYFENATTLFAYALRATDEASKFIGFTGQVSFDGASQPVLGVTVFDVRTPDVSPATVQFESGFQLKFTGLNETPIKIESTETLSADTWQSIGTIDVDGSSIYWKDPRLDNPQQRFYRFNQEPLTR